MPVCDVCGNDYARAYQVTAASGEKYTFDSVECAAHKIAPICPHCDCRILGHGIETQTGIYCCANCARHAGAQAAVDNTVKASSN